MSNTLRQYIRESLLLREEATEEPEKDFSFTKEEDLSEHPELEAVRDSYDYIATQKDISELPNNLNAGIGGLGYFLSRDDMKGVVSGLLTTLEADKADIDNTLYPYRTALFLQGLEKGQMTSPEGFAEIAGGLLVPAIVGAAQGIESLRVDENLAHGRLLSENWFTKGIVKFYKALPAPFSNTATAIKKFVGSPSSALAKEIEKVAGETLSGLASGYGADKAGFLESASKYLLDVSGAQLDNTDLMVKELAARARKNNLTAFDLADPEKITDEFATFATAAIAQAKAARALGVVKTYGPIGMRAALVNSALGGVVLGGLPVDAIISPETALALVTSYTIRKETQKAIKSLIDYFNNSDFWISKPAVTPAEMVEILRSNTLAAALPAPGGAYAVTSGQLQELIDDIKAKGGTQAETRED